MGMPVSFGMDPEMAEKSFVWTTSKGTGTNPSRIGDAEGERSDRGDATGRSRPHGDLDTTEVFGVAGGWICKREECHLGCQDNGEEPEFCRSEFLGTGLLCFDGRSRRRDDTGICPKPGRG